MSSDQMPHPSTPRALSPDPTLRCVSGLVLLTPSKPHRVLVGIRAFETNTRHPGVISVPTMRIPRSLAGSLVESLDPAVAGAELVGSISSFGMPGSTESIQGLLVEAILAKKLELGGFLESGLIQGHCSVGLIAQGPVDDPTGVGEAPEETLMVTILAYCETGEKYLPGSSKSYSQIAWVDTCDLVTAWSCRDGQILFPEANPFEICIRGLCISSAVDVINRLDAAASRCRA